MTKLSISTSDTSSLNIFMTYVHSYPCLTAPQHHCTNDKCKSERNEVIDICEGVEVRCTVWTPKRIRNGIQGEEWRTLAVEAEGCGSTVVSFLPFFPFYCFLWCECVCWWREVVSRIALHRRPLLCSVMTISNALISDTSSEQKSNRILTEVGRRTRFSLLFLFFAADVHA